MSIHERDITPAVCQRRAKCCEIDIRVPNTDSRYRAFLRGVGLRISPMPANGQIDCCQALQMECSPGSTNKCLTAGGMEGNSCVSGAKNFCTPTGGNACSPDNGNTCGGGGTDVA